MTRRSDREEKMQSSFFHDNPEIRDEVEMRVREHYGLPVPEEFRQTETGAEAAKDRSDLELS